MWAVKMVYVSLFHADAYMTHALSPEQMTEADFWSRYFRSRLWDRHRASARAQGASGLQKVDPVFDRYLEEPDDDVEPKHAPSRAVDLFLDLAATEEDHGQTGNERDVTMQPGRQRGTLPLIRRFNEHSNRLVAQEWVVAGVIREQELISVCALVKRLRRWRWIQNTWEVHR